MLHEMMISDIIQLIHRTHIQ